MCYKDAGCLSGNCHARKCRSAANKGNGTPKQPPKNGHADSTSSKTQPLSTTTQSQPKGTSTQTQTTSTQTSPTTTPTSTQPSKNEPLSGAIGYEVGGERHYLLESGSVSPKQLVSSTATFERWTLDSDGHLVSPSENTLITEGEFIYVGGVTYPDGSVDTDIGVPYVCTAGPTNSKMRALDCVARIPSSYHGTPSTSRDFFHCNAGDVQASLDACYHAPAGGDRIPNLFLFEVQDAGLGR